MMFSPAGSCGESESLEEAEVFVFRFGFSKSALSASSGGESGVGEALAAATGSGSGEGSAAPATGVSGFAEEAWRFHVREVRASEGGFLGKRVGRAATGRYEAVEAFRRDRDRRRSMSVGEGTIDHNAPRVTDFHDATWNAKPPRSRQELP